MLICLKEILTPTEIIAFKTLATEKPLADGKKTAGGAAARVKKNRQTPLASEAGKLLRTKTIEALKKHPVFSAAASPYKFGPVLYAEYAAGDAYGLHVDNPVMQAEGAFVRTDISVTIWLNDPETYTGGALTISDYSEDRPYKLSAGDGILYPSDSLHEVTEVTAGHRNVIVTWVQSFVKDKDIRATLFDLSRLKQAEFAKNGKSEAYDTLCVCHGRLYRRYAEV